MVNWLNTMMLAGGHKLRMNYLGQTLKVRGWLDQGFISSMRLPGFE